MPNRDAVARPLALDRDARFLSFNYTPTLERLYDVSRQNILYIHGCAAEPGSRLILGHGWEPSDDERLSAGSDGPDDNWRVRDGLEHLDRYFAETLKPTAEIIAQNRASFASLHDVDEVLIMGHGLHAVDAPYFEAVMASVDLTKTRWSVSTYHDLQERQLLFGAFDINPKLVRYLPMTEM
jgi:hypothetical protein